MGTLNLAAPLALFEKSRLRAGTGFHLLPSFHHPPTQHNYTSQTVTHTVTVTSTFYSAHCTDNLARRNVVCPSGAWLENRPHSTPSIRLERNPKRVIVQWVDIGAHTHMFVLQHKNSPKLLNIAFEFPLQVTFAPSHESNMVFSQQFYFLNKELFGNWCLIFFSAYTKCSEKSRRNFRYVFLICSPK